MIPPGGAVARGPSTALPLSFLVAAATAFVVAALSVPALAHELAGHYYHRHLVALAHTVTLGWITLAIMGASYQLIPVVLEVALWSERLARWQFWVAVAGVAGMVAHFYIGEWRGLAWAAGAVAVAVAMHLVNVALSIHALARWTFTARLVALACGGLALTTLFGLTLAADRAWGLFGLPFFPALHAHFHVALLGWVAPMVLGVAARVYPMFLLAEEPGGSVGAVQLWGLALGVPAVAVGIVAAPPLAAAGALGVAAALAGHLVWVARMLQQRKRPALDWGLRLVLTGAAFLVPATLLGLALAFGALAGPRASLAYAVLALGGWVTLTIAGMMLKIVPFLVWYRVYAPRVGREPVPSLARLSWPLAERAAWALLATGVAALALAVWTGEPAAIGTAGVMVALGALAFATALGRVLSRLVEPRRPAGETAEAPAR